MYVFGTCEKSLWFCFATTVEKCCLVSLVPCQMFLPCSDDPCITSTHTFTTFTLPSAHTRKKCKTPNELTRLYSGLHHLCSILGDYDLTRTLENSEVTPYTPPLDCCPGILDMSTSAECSCNLDGNGTEGAVPNVG